MQDEIELVVKTEDVYNGCAVIPSNVSSIKRKYPVPILGDNGDKRLILNPDTEKVMEVVNKIKENKGMCPSKCNNVRPGSLTPDNRCPCPDLIIYGKCDCGLFVETDLIPLVKEDDTNE